MKNKLSLVIGIILIIIHGLYPKFIIDYITIALYLILVILMNFEYVESLKFYGINVIFGKRLKKLRHDFNEDKDEIKENANKKIKLTKKKKEIYKTFNFSVAEKLIDDDPSLAIASIRIEIENKLRLAYSVLVKKDHDRLSLNKIINEIDKNCAISPLEVNLLLMIISTCNSVIHGAKISKDEAREILNMVEELNNSFSIGYSINFKINKEYKKYGLICPWEHCIEHMPLTERITKKSCPVFGHDCPDGKKQVKECKKLDCQPK